MKQLIESFDNLSQLHKLVLATPALDILWWIYRLCKDIEQKNTGGIILAIVLYLFAAPLLWILDIIFIIKDNKVWWIDKN